MANIVRLLIYASQAVMVSLIITCYTASSSHGIDSLINSSKTKDLNECPQDKQWFCFNSTTKAYSCNQLQAAVSGRITCSDNGPIVEIGSCATYDENTHSVCVQIKQMSMTTIGLQYFGVYHCPQFLLNSITTCVVH